MTSSSPPVSFSRPGGAFSIDQTFHVAVVMKMKHFTMLGKTCPKTETSQTCNISVWSTSFSASLSSASFSLTLWTNICLISSSFFCSSPMNSFLLASYVSWRLVGKQKSKETSKCLYLTVFSNVRSYKIEWSRMTLITWRACCQDLYPWSPSPLVCSGGTAHNDVCESALEGPPCSLWWAFLAIWQSHSDSHSPLLWTHKQVTHQSYSVKSIQHLHEVEKYNKQSHGLVHRW